MAMMGFFPGGALRIATVYTNDAGSLPAGVRAGTIGVITTLEVTRAYAQKNAPASPTAGDVWVWVGGESRAPIALSETITIYPRGVYQWTGAAWALREAYAYTGSAWAEITLFVYDNGADILGNIVQIYSKSPLECYITKETARILIHMYVPGDHADLWASTFSTIDLTNVSGIRFKLSGDVMPSTRVGIGSTQNGQAAYLVPTGDDTLDVSGFTGPYYINFYSGLGNEGGLITGYLYEVELVR